MIRIKLNAIGKEFAEKTIFKNINLELAGNTHLSVTGFNGSGKSTFLQLIAAYSTPSSGTINYFANEKLVEPKNWYLHLSYAAPYIDFPEDLTLKENILFFTSFKKLQNNLSVKEVAEISLLAD